MSTERHSIGAMSEYLVAAHLAGKGCDVFFPSTNTRADLVYCNGTDMVRAQVKTGTKVRTGGYTYEQCRLRTRGVYHVASGEYRNHKPYDSDEVDELWVVGTHIWCFPAEVFVGRPSISLGGNGPGTERKDRPYDPNDFIVVRGSWDSPMREILCHSA